MSILNVRVESDFGLVAVDTLGAVGGASISCSKITILAHLNAVLAVRGVSTLLSTTAMLASMIKADTIDDLDGEVRELLPPAQQMAQQFLTAASQVTGQSPPTLACAHELVLIGWSDRRGRMFGSHWACNQLGCEWVRTELEAGDFLTGPAVEGARPIQSRAHAMELARIQVQLHRDADTGPMCGGVLRLATVRRGSVSIRDIGHLGSY